MPFNVGLCRLHSSSGLEIVVGRQGIVQNISGFNKRSSHFYWDVVRSQGNVASLFTRWNVACSAPGVVNTAHLSSSQTGLIKVAVCQSQFVLCRDIAFLLLKKKKQQIDAKPQDTRRNRSDNLSLQLGAESAQQRTRSKTTKRRFWIMGLCTWCLLWYKNKKTGLINHRAITAKFGHTQFYLIFTYANVASWWMWKHPHWLLIRVLPSTANATRARLRSQRNK